MVYLDDYVKKVVDIKNYEERETLDTLIKHLNRIIELEFYDN